MIVEDLNGNVVVVRTPEELELALLPRIDGTDFATFWISPDESQYPALTVAVNGQYADVHYFVARSGTFWRSIGPSAGLIDGGETLFCIAPSAPEPSPNEFVIPLEAALQAAKQFLLQPLRPDTIRWLDL